MIYSFSTITVKLERLYFCRTCFAVSKLILIQLSILLTKTKASQNDVALSYRRVRGLYFLAVAFAATIVTMFSIVCHSTYD